VEKIQIQVFQKHKHILEDFIEEILPKEIRIIISTQELINILLRAILILSKLVKNALMVLLQKLVINIIMKRPKIAPMFPIYNQKEARLVQKELKFLDRIS